MSAFGIPLQKALLAAAQAGAAGVEIDARNELKPADLTGTAKRQIRKMLDDLNLRVSSIRFPTRRGYDVLQDLDRRIDATRQAMEMAYELGAPHVVNQIGPVPTDSASPAWHQLQSVLADLASFGARVGAFFAPETGTESGRDLANLVESLDEHFVPVAFNPGLLIVGGFDPHEAIGILASRIGVVVAQDGVKDLSRGRALEVPLGQGIADFPKILGMLEEHQYRGWFVVGQTGDGFAKVADAVSYLRHLGEPSS